jgi:hypothetical protein
VTGQDAAYYRERARTMRKLAARAESGSVKASYLLIARNWEMMADHAQHPGALESRGETRLLT